MRVDPAGRSGVAVTALLVLAGLILPLLVGLSPAQAQNAAADSAPPANSAPKLSAEQLDQLVAPIALYPDALLAQVLMASAYPVDVVAADRFMQKNPNLTGDQMEQALEKQPWDISVKTLTHFPSVLKYMDENLDWTQQLGDAFVNQQPDVMASVQHMRAQAYAAGNLKSGPQQTVTQSGSTIVIAPADGQTIYVPQYNPQVVYVQAPATVVTNNGTTTVITQPTTTVVTQPTTTVVQQPGYSTGDLVATGLLSFTAGVVVGSLIADNNNWCDWNHGAVYVPVYRGPSYGWAGWGRPPAGWGYNGWNNVNHYGNNNVNIHNTNINVNNGSFQRWQPNATRRPAAIGGQATNLQTQNRDFGYASGSNNQLANRGQAGTNNALSGYGRGTTTQQNAARGQQSLQNANRGTVKPQSTGTYKPQGNQQANRGTGNYGQNSNRSFGSGNGVFGSNNGRGFDRQASQRGGNSMRSAQQRGFRPKF